MPGGGSHSSLRIGGLGSSDSLASGRTFRTSRVGAHYHRTNATRGAESRAIISDEMTIKSYGGVDIINPIRNVRTERFVRHLSFGKILHGEVFSSGISRRLWATSPFPPIPGRRKSRRTNNWSIAQSQVIRESKIKRHVRPTFSLAFVYARPAL